VIVVADDGAGISVKLIREKAIALGLTDSHSKLTDEEACSSFWSPDSAPPAILRRRRGAESAWTSSLPKSKSSAAVCSSIRPRQGFTLHDSPALYSGHQPGSDRARRR